MGAVDLDGLILEPVVPRSVLCSRHPPDPVGVARDERLGEHDEVGPVGAGVCNLVGDDVKCGLAVEVGGCPLNGGDAELSSTAHRVAPATTSSHGPTKPLSVSNRLRADSISVHTESWSVAVMEPSI